MVRLIREADYSETDEFSLIKDLGELIDGIKKDFIDNKDFEEQLANYFYYDEGKHQQDFKELEASVKDVQKLFDKLENLKRRIDNLGK